MCCSLFILSFLLLIKTSTSQTPPQIIDIIVEKLWESNSITCSMYSYNYGGGIIFDAMYRATNQFSPNEINYNTTIILDYNHLLSPILHKYIYDDITTPGFRIIHNQKIPFDAPEEMAIGDDVGLFPIAYIDQLLYIFMNNTNNTAIFNFTGKYSNEWKLIFTTADYYILQFPRQLTDSYHTVSRYTSGDWKHEPNNNSSFVWADDDFMANILLMRLIKVLHFCDKYINQCNGINVQNNISTYIDFIYDQHIGFSTHLMYDGIDNNGLYAHGYNYNTNDHSCCPWGRANAWILSSNLEAIKMYKYLNNSKYNTQYNNILQLFKNQINKVVSLQDNNGQWHQIINDTSTFFESSCSAGFLSDIIEGVLMDILPIDKYNKIIQLGWNGLLKFIDLDSGEISNGCCGTGIQNSVKEYEERSTAYCRIGNPGVAAFIINAITSYQRYLNKISV
eukprot:454595_1